jgi:hypothetical protein
MKIHPQDNSQPPSPTAMNQIENLTPITFQEFERQATVLLALLEAQQMSVNDFARAQSDLIHRLAIQSPELASVAARTYLAGFPGFEELCDPALAPELDSEDVRILETLLAVKKLVLGEVPASR